MTETLPPILEAFGPYGPVADLHALADDVRLLWQLPMRYLHDAVEPARASQQEPETPLDSSFAYVVNGTFNAAIRHEERAVGACIFVGVPLVAFRACRQIASRMDLRTGLPLCDDAQRLVAFPSQLPLEPEWHGVHDPSAQAMEELARFEATAPSENRELATFLFDIAMRYVTMHETMHFVLGHARFCQSELGLDTFADVSDERRALDPVLSQTLEFIADRHTVAGLRTDLTDGRLYHEWCRDTPPEVTVEPDVWRRRVLVAALALVSKLWKGDASWQFAEFTHAYPHPYERVAWMLSGLVEMSPPTARADLQRCFALTLATLERNFTSPLPYSGLMEDDLSALRVGGVSQLDRSYEVVRAKAIEVQKVLYRTYGPYYPGV
ncbi:MAG TPA: hypothetical protein VFN10_19285 [Thermoanaerobaculia bacterium]|nr:hypothetical protein [Thermoanaerobaculia bacterium]